MKIYDITLPIKNNMLVWPGDSAVFIEIKTTVKKDGYGQSHFSFGSHTGTHVDAPNHFLEDGLGIDSIDPQKLIGKCIVVDLMNLDHLEITSDDIKDIELEKGARILFKTGNFKYLKGSVFPKDYISLSLEGAKYLVDRGVVLVGTDFLGIEKQKNPDHPVHKTLLTAGIVNVEGLDLSEIEPGEYQIFCMPLKVAGADGAPARVFLVKD